MLATGCNFGQLRFGFLFWCRKWHFAYSMPYVALVIAINFSEMYFVRRALDTHSVLTNDSQYVDVVSAGRSSAILTIILLLHSLRNTSDSQDFRVNGSKSLADIKGDHQVQRHYSVRVYRRPLWFHLFGRAVHVALTRNFILKRRKFIECYTIENHSEVLLLLLSSLTVRGQSLAFLTGPSKDLRSLASSSMI